MEAYTGFAGLYDRFMDNVPYDEWEERLAGTLAEYGVRPGDLVLELGCGTGTMTERMADRGYGMIGVDISEDMLAEAFDKRCESGNNILYLNQDMRELELYGSVAAVYCICDSLNYITEPEDLVRVFRRVDRYLDPDGIFVFDFNTPAEYRSPLRRAPIVEEQDGVTMIWENDYDEESRINEHFVIFFVPTEVDTGAEDWMEEQGQIRQSAHDGETLYAKVEEVHVQRAYTLVEIREAVEEAGMSFLTAVGAEEDAGRIYCVVRKAGA